MKWAKIEKGKIKIGFTYSTATVVVDSFPDVFFLVFVVMYVM